MKKILWIGGIIIIGIGIVFFVGHKKTEAPTQMPIVTNTAEMAPVAFEDLSDFYQYFQTLVANDKHFEIAELVNYPLVLSDGTQIYNREVFVEKYPVLFNDTLKAVIHDQDPYDIFERDQGGMIGNGEIWFFDYRISEDASHEYKIKTLNSSINN